MKWIFRIALFFVFVFLAGLLVPQNFRMHVEGATSKDYNLRV